MTSPGGQSGQPSWDPSRPAGSVPPPTGTDAEATSDYPVYEYPAIEEPGPTSAPWQQGPPAPAPQVPPQPPTGPFPMPPGPPPPMPPGPPPPGFYGAPPAGPYGPPPGMAPPGYLPPSGYLPPPLYSSYPAPRSNDGMAIGSLVSSLVALPLYFICFVFGPAGSVLGIVLGTVALAQAKGRPRTNGRTMAIAGIVIGAVTLVVGLVGFLLLFDWASRQEPTL
ncbi:DUF4190 domain-containing protein [Mycolicibacterium mucogenicum]|uniref:DUF4190 domain-containing protein n=1 Tax=Mycolicibacterium mucogenicum DSM 44124 TaxID=1226753 RepID=A0A8E4W3U4_MYCMU|nr:DUF4190 domain-containing protein [Mycolicibacterium mucogenicum]QPG70567.1 DUF4190 domain-containing protein [Mycolicibacterium mucogenicum DSM 44124]